MKGNKPTLESTPDRLVDGFGVVTVKDGQIEGLPARAHEELRAAVLAKVAAFTSSKGGRKAAAAEPSIRSASAQGKEIDGLFEHGDLLLDGEEHRAALLKALAVATELVIVHSTFISAQGWKQILPAMIGAAARGTTVQVVWGQSDDQNETSSSRVEATALKAAIREVERSDKILVHPFTTGSHSKILVSDNGQGRWSALVGSCNWLSTDFTSFESSIHGHRGQADGDRACAVSGASQQGRLHLVLWKSDWAIVRSRCRLSNGGA